MSVILNRSRAQLVLVDLQDKLLPKIIQHQAVLAATGTMVRTARLLGVPILLTEQYPKGLGKTHKDLAGLLDQPPAEPIVKLHFSCARNEDFLSALARTDRRQVILVGIETHICVQQTALDLAAAGYEVFVCADAVGSRYNLDHRTALERMRQAGIVVTTTEAAVFELAERAGTDEFKQISKLLRKD